MRVNQYNNIVSGIFILVLFFVFIIVIIICYVLMRGNIKDSRVKDTNVIERTCLKCFISPHHTKIIYKSTCFIPSLYEGSSHDINYTTYYDYKDRSIYMNRLYYKNTDVPAVVRIRSYQKTTNKYLELKWKGTKIRGALDNNLDLIEDKTISKTEYDKLMKYLYLIKSNEMNPVFSNSYKRASFILSKDQHVRATLDSDLIFNVNDTTYIFPHNILELKIPKDYNKEKISDLKKSIESICKLKVDFITFSKFEHGYSTYFP